MILVDIYKTTVSTASAKYEENTPDHRKIAEE